MCVAMLLPDRFRQFVTTFNKVDGHRPLTQTGFTLIELLVAIAIIGVLSSAVLVAINPSQRLQQARDSQRKSDLAQIRNSLDTYAAANDGHYPSTGGVFQCDDCGASDTPNTTYTASNWIPDLVD